MDYNSRFISRNRAVMIMLGIWPLLNVSKFVNFAYKIYYFMLQVSYSTFVITLTFGLQYSLKNSNPMEKANAIQFVLCYGFVLYKMAVLQTRPIWKLLNIIAEEEKKIMTGAARDVKSIYLRLCNYNFKVFYAQFVSTILVCILFAMLVYSDFQHWNNRDPTENNNSTTHDSFVYLPEWLPYDEQTYFKITYFYQAFNRLLGGIILIECDTLIISLIWFPTLRLEILGHKFKQHEINTGILRNLILEHKEIIEYTKTFNDSIKWYFFYDFILRSYFNSLMILQIMALDQFLQIDAFFAVTYCLLFMFQLYTIYYHVNELGLKSMDICMSIYQNEWYKYSSEIKRSIMIIMMRSQRPLQLYIGYLNAITNDLIVKMTKAAYTYVIFSTLEI